MILVFREFFLKPLFIQSAVGRGFYPSVSLTWLLDQEAQKVTFQQQEHVSENAVRVFLTHSCLSLFDPMDCSPPGSSVRGILQA